MTDLEKLLKLIKDRPVSTEIRLYEKGMFEGDIVITINKTKSFFFDGKGRCTDFYLFGNADNLEEAFEELEKELAA